MGARSLKKGPFVDHNIYKAVEKLTNAGKTGGTLKTNSRGSTIIPDFVGFTIAVNDGRKYVPVYITETMVGHKLGEFVLTRKPPSHSSDKKTKK